jgi:hypothetical protein
MSHNIIPPIDPDNLSPAKSAYRLIVETLQVRELFHQQVSQKLRMEYFDNFPELTVQLLSTCLSNEHSLSIPHLTDFIESIFDKEAKKLNLKAVLHSIVLPDNLRSPDENVIFTEIQCRFIRQVLSKKPELLLELAPQITNPSVRSALIARFHHDPEQLVRLALKFNGTSPLRTLDQRMLISKLDGKFDLLAQLAPAITEAETQLSLIASLKDSVRLKVRIAPHLSSPEALSRLVDELATFPNQLTKIITLLKPYPKLQREAVSRLKDKRDLLVQITPELTDDSAKRRVIDHISITPVYLAKITQYIHKESDQIFLLEHLAHKDYNPADLAKAITANPSKATLIDALLDSSRADRNKALTIVELLNMLTIEDPSWPKVAKRVVAYSKASEDIVQNGGFLIGGLAFGSRDTWLRKVLAPFAKKRIETSIEFRQKDNLPKIKTTRELRKGLGRVLDR